MKTIAAGLFLSAMAFCQQQNVVVYREAGHFAGWPANHGIWSWGNEIVVGFEVGHFRSNGKHEHAIDYTQPEKHYLARSLDGGETWNIEIPASLQPPEGAKIAGVPAAPGGKAAIDCPGGIRFTDPNFAMTVRMEDIHVGPSRFYYSYDRGKTWRVHSRFPTSGRRVSRREPIIR